MKRSFLCAALLLAGCGEHREAYLGYVEGEYVRVASPIAGRLEVLSVQRGQTIDAGAPLFVLERAREQAALDEARHRLEAARAQVEADGPARTAKRLAALQAQRVQAESALKLAQAQLQRRQQLVRDGAVSKEVLDQARAERDAAQARIAELDAQLRAGSAEVAAAEAAMAQAQWQFDQKAASATGKAFVEETYFRTGEWVPAGTPVVSLLPQENRKLRFYVPQAELARVAPGRKVRVHCDGCGAPMQAQVSFVASEAEFTPPVIYSQDQRTRLVFRVEARPTPEDALRLQPGLPVDVEPAGD